MGSKSPSQAPDSWRRMPSPSGPSCRLPHLTRWLVLRAVFEIAREDSDALFRRVGVAEQIAGSFGTELNAARPGSLRALKSIAEHCFATCSTRTDRLAI
jgi:hypothetical protein